jgi:hypothetical protein
MNTQNSGQVSVKDILPFSGAKLLWSMNTASYLLFMRTNICRGDVVVTGCHQSFIQNQ